MVFSGPVFILFFLPAVILAYHLFPKRGRNVVLFFESHFLRLGRTQVHHPHAGNRCGRICIGDRDGASKGRTRAQTDPHPHDDLRSRRTRVFKYAGFFVENANALGLGLPAVTIALPLGISFYTFQTLSYTIDVYRRDVEYQPRFLPFATYVTMFPQLVAGPIVRYHDIAIEMETRTESLSLFGEGVEDFIFGFAKKCSSRTRSARFGTV